MKTIKHILRYLFSPHYRFWVDFCTRKENVDQTMNLVMHNLELASKPLFMYDEGKITQLINHHE